MADGAERNVISGNNRGVTVTDVGSDHNTVAGNYIGPDVTGVMAVGNSSQGVTIANGASFNVIGTNGDGNGDDAERNIISGNNASGGGQAGVLISTADQNVVAGNLIGTDATGTVALGNGRNGIKIVSGSQFNRIGTNGDGISDADERNVISANALRGVLIGFNSGNDHNVIAGNYIGTDITGTVGLGNGGLGVHISGGNAENVIGTDGDGIADAVERNLISGNAGSGVRIQGVGSDHNTIAGNFIGTDVTGTAAVGNTYSGVAISNGAQFNVVGTNGDGVSDSVERNIISGNQFQDGIVISNSGTTHNTVSGNYIGTDVTGTIGLGNGVNGITIEDGAQSNVIGTNGDGAGDAVEGNVISFNGHDGVALKGDGTDFNVIAGNFIGTDATGTQPLGNGTIASDDGVSLRFGPKFNRIGTDGDGVSDAVEGNVIAANSGAGILILDPGTDNNVAAGNYIGTDVSGTVGLGNHNGVRIGGGAANNLIGTDGDGTADADEGNIIAFNAGDGVRVSDSDGTGNTIRQNSIHSNGNLGNRLGSRWCDGQ